MVGGTARFPDAPTPRGARHLDELSEARRRGFVAAVLFCIQRPDAIRFAPNNATDPGFGAALRRASAAGVADDARVAYVGRRISHSTLISTPASLRRL